MRYRMWCAVAVNRFNDVEWTLLMWYVMWQGRDVKWQSVMSHRVSTHACGASPQPGRDMSVWGIHIHWHVNRAVFLRPNHDCWFCVRCGSGPWFLPDTLGVFTVYPARIHTQRTPADGCAVSLSPSTRYRCLLNCTMCTSGTVSLSNKQLTCSYCL